MSGQAVVILVLVAGLVVFMYTRRTSRRSGWSRREDITHYDRDAERSDVSRSDEDDDD